VEIQTKGYCVNLPVLFICVSLLTWHSDSGQLHLTIEPCAALKLHATSHSCYAIWRVRPGRVLRLARPHIRPTGRAGPSFRADRRFYSIRDWAYDNSSFRKSL